MTQVTTFKQITDELATRIAGVYYHVTNGKGGAWIDLGTIRYLIDPDNLIDDRTWTRAAQKAAQFDDAEVAPECPSEITRGMAHGAAEVNGQTVHLIRFTSNLF